MRVPVIVWEKGGKACTFQLKTILYRLDLTYIWKKLTWPPVHLAISSLGSTTFSRTSQSRMLFMSQCLSWFIYTYVESVLMNVRSPPPNTFFKVVSSHRHRVRVNQRIHFPLNIAGFPLSAPPPAGCTHWSLAVSGNPKTFSGKRIH
jgi:hypothetical protein